ncbi:MAG TPA: hypothetical protein VGE86_05650, partial [Thermoanaerobaculia bacterium]
TRDDDLWIRSVIHASTEDLRRSLDVARLDPDLIAVLYLRLRESLETWDGISEGELVEQATFTVYLTATAWAPAGEPGPALLDSIRTRIAATVAASAIVGGKRQPSVQPRERS